MIRTKQIGSVILILASGILAAATIRAERPRSPAQVTMDNCDRQLAKDWKFCEGTKDSATRRKCDENAEAKWKRCYEKAGWVFSVQGQPKLPFRKPFAVRPQDTAPASAGVNPGKPSPKLVPVKDPKAPAALKSTPTPTPRPKKVNWVVPGPRQTGSHMH